MNSGVKRKRRASEGDGWNVASKRSRWELGESHSLSPSWRYEETKRGDDEQAEEGGGESGGGESWAEAEDVEAEDVVPLPPAPPPRPPPPHQIPGFHPPHYYSLRTEPAQKYKGLISKHNFSIFLTKDLPDEAGVEAYLLAIGAHAMDRVMQEMDPNDIGQIHASNPNFRNDSHYTGFRPVSQLDFATIVDRIAAVLQSDDEVDLTETTFFITSFPPRPRVGARTTGLMGRHESDMAAFCRKKGCTMDPLAACNRRSPAMAQMCLPLSISVGVQFYKMGCHFHKKGTGDMLRKKLRDFVRTKELEKQALDLVKKAGLSVRKAPFSFADVGLMQAALGDEYQVCLYASADQPLLSFGRNKAPRHINVFVHNVQGSNYHAVFINSMAALMGQDRFCELCKQGYQGVHKCRQSSCEVCRQVECENSGPAAAEPPARCVECNGSWKTAACFDAHKTVMCDKFRYCLLCWQRSRATDADKHLCGRPYCRYCGIHHSPIQHCFVQPDPEKTRSSPRIYCFDAETFTDKSGSHTAILYVVRGPNLEGEEVVWEFKGLSATADFVEALIVENSVFADSYFFSHNGGRFDSHLILAYLIKLKMPPRTLAKGQTLLDMALRQNKIVFRDTLQFMPGVPLASFPKNFGLDNGEKGHNPHKLNWPEYLDFEEPKAFMEAGKRFPDKRLFHPEAMRPKEKKAFEVWHSKEEAAFERDPTKRYYPAMELLKYCHQDVRILHQGWTKYRQEWLRQFSDMDPANFLTFPKYNNAVLRNKYMEKESLAMLPPQGFEFQNNQNSRECYSWLHCVKADLAAAGAEVVLERSGRKGFEVCLSGVKVDGFFRDCQGRQHVLQYHGCHWHGCPQCNNTPTEEARKRYRETLDKSQRLSALSTNPQSPYGPFTYHEMWGHDFAAWSRKGHRHAERLRRFNARWKKDVLRPRDALFGGRTNAIQHCIPSVDIARGWRLQYVDFTSLYPAVMYGTDGQLWPMGFPKIYIGLEVEEEGPPLETAFGLWKVRVHPPRHLRHPVLPQSFNDKLVFALCRTCAQTEHQGFCTHERDDRAIHGTFLTEELKKAVEMGYELDPAEEIWDWPVEQRSAEMYRPMIRDQYKKKVVSSTYSSEAEMEEAMEELRVMNISFQKDDFVPNESLRNLAKFSLNNIWGFLGKKSNPNTTDFITDPKKIYSIVDDPSKQLLSVDIVNEDVAQMSWKFVKEEAGKNQSIVHALITTAYSRLKLYSVLEAFPEEVVYFDTDSAFLLLPPGKAGPPTSTRLGDLKDEIKPGQFISCFYTSGPKSYGYKKVDSSGVVVGVEHKAKGISLTSAAVEKANLETLKKLIQDRDAVVQVPQWQIGREMGKGRLFSRDFLKRFRFSSTKRWILPDSPTLDTLPFGYS